MRYIYLAMLCVTSILVMTGCDDGKKNVKKRPEVIMTLKSAPKGATVFVDGKKLATTTPLEHDLKDNDEHMMEIRAKGHEIKWLRIPKSDIGKNAAHDFGEIKLIPLRVPMILRSVPSGALVSMDGDDLGKTPKYLKSVSPGTHNVTFSFAGHAKMHKRIEVSKGELKNVIVNLESITCTVTVLTKPAGAEVFIRGEPKGPSDSDGRLVVENVPQGVCGIEVRKSGFQDRKLTLVLKPRENKVISVPELVTKPGNLKVECTPEGAKVYRDGLLIGEAPLIMNGLAPAQYTIKITKKGYEPKTKIVKVIPNMTKTVPFELSSMYGSITVVSQPSECAVIIDGSTKGTTEKGDVPGTSKPLKVNELKPGVRGLVFEKAGFESIRKNVLVKKGKNIRIPVIKLRKLWVPTHQLRTKGEMNVKKVRLIIDNGDTIDVEYQKGAIKMRIQKSKIEQFTPIK